MTNPETAPFWEAAAAGQVPGQALQGLRRGPLVSAHHLPVLPLRQDGVGGEPGEGTIYTYTVMRRSPTGPYAIGYVTLDEGPSMLTNFVDCDRS